MSKRTEGTSNVFAPVALLVVAMASIQAGAAVAKHLFPVVGSTGAAALRLLFGTIILCAVLRPWRLRLNAAAWRSVVVYGVALGGMNALFYAALRTVPLGVGVALEFTGPLFVALLASRRAADFLWVGLAVGGLLLLLPLGSEAAGVDPVGAAYALGAGACWAFYIIFGQKAGEGHGVRMTAVGMVVAAACVLPFGVAQAGASLLTPGILPYALAVAVLSSALPYSLEMFALERLPAKTFGTLMSLEPAIGALSGFVILRERLAPSQWLAIGAVMAASIGATATAARGGAAPHLSDPPLVGVDDEPR
jgi:inner membrane transporter RhtA